MTGAPEQHDDDLGCRDWICLAACLGMRVYTLDRLRVHDVDHIVATCGRCPVKTTCLTYGVEGREHGVWGGKYLRAGRPRPDWP